MRIALQVALWLLVPFVGATSVHAAYTETMDANGLAKNLQSDRNAKDNFSVYCGITLTPLQTNSDTKDRPVSRATAGTVRDCRIFNASPGYERSMGWFQGAAHMRSPWAREV
ncbi:MAG: hypothetical protein JXB62_18965 [Pirellulales bacterium]|nr:hypothetical protein [Pirellulales bacterium]